MVRTTRVGRSPRGRNPSSRVQIPASPLPAYGKSEKDRQAPKPYARVQSEGAHRRRLLVVEQNCPAESTPMSSPIAESPVRSRCDHSEVEDLGTAGIVEFYRCTRCRDVVVVQGSRRWAVTAILED